jgi:hypothetical protein
MSARPVVINKNIRDGDMDIEKEITKSLLKDYYNKLVNNPLFPVWVGIVDFGVKRDLQYELNRTNIAKISIKMFPDIPQTISAVSLEGIGFGEKLRSMTADIKIPDMYTEWMKIENFGNKSDLVFNLYRIERLEEKLEKEYKIDVEYDLEKKGIRFIDILHLFTKIPSE